MIMELLRTHCAHERHLNQMPNVITYSTLISASEKGRQPARAHEVLQAMQRQGAVPNVITCNAVIRASSTGNQPEQALEVSQAMR